MAGIYGGQLAKRGDGKLRTVQIVTQSQNLGAAAINGQQIQIPSGYGDIVGLGVSLSVICTGTLTSAKTIDNALSQFNIKTASGTNLSQGMSATDLNILEYLTSRYGALETFNTASNSTTNNLLIFQFPIAQADLPGSIQPVYAPFSALASSGCTGATVTLAVTGYYRQGATLKTQGINKMSQSLASGTNSIANILPLGKTVNTILLGQTEADLTEVVFSSDGSAEHDMLLADLQHYIDSDRVTAHPSGYLLVPCSPFVVSSNTVLKDITSSTDTLTLYAFWTAAAGS